MAEKHTLGRFWYFELLTVDNSNHTRLSLWTKPGGRGWVFENKKKGLEKRRP